MATRSQYAAKVAGRGVPVADPPWRNLWSKVVPVTLPWCSLCGGDRGRHGGTYQLIDKRGEEVAVLLRLCDKCVGRPSGEVGQIVGRLLRTGQLPPFPTLRPGSWSESMLDMQKRILRERFPDKEQRL